MEYIVDTHALRVRLAIDGRTIGLIARDANLPIETIKNVLETGKADKNVIEKIRLAVKPKMYFSTICPKSLQAKNESISREESWLGNKEFYNDVKRNLEIQKRISDICKEYSTIEVFDTISEWQSHILNYVSESGFNLLELLDESMDDLAPGYELNEKGEVQYIEKRRINK